MPNFSIRIAATPPLKAVSAPPATPGMMNPPGLVLTSFNTLEVDRAAAPNSNGAPIERFDLRYSQDEATWTVIQDIADPETLGGLTASSQIFVQTRAVNALGDGPWSLSNAVFTSAAPTPPGSIGAGDWTLRDDGNGGGMTIGITSLPDDGGSPITDLEFQTQGGGWISLGGTGAGNYQIFVLGLDTPVDVAIRAVNAVGPAQTSDIKTETPSFAPASLSGTVLPQQDLPRGVPIAPIDTSVLFIGRYHTIDIDPSTPEPLPEGLSIATSGLITGTAVESTIATDLPSVYLRATGDEGSATYTQGLVFNVGGPNLEALSFEGHTATLSSDTAGGTMHLWFGTDPNPSDANIIAGDGPGFLAARDFAITEVGGSTTNWDLSAYESVQGYLLALQVAEGGGFSNRLFVELTPRIANTVPAAFGETDWSVVDAATGGRVTITVNALPADGGTALTAIEYQIDGGAWATLTATPAIGDYDVTGLTNGVEVGLALRAVNAEGAAAAPVTRLVTPTLDLPVLSGTILPQQDLLRGVNITPIDVSVLFSGGTPTFDLDPNSPATLPLGLSMDANGLITGMPSEFTYPSDLPNVQIRATGAAGSATYAQGVIFRVTGPNVEALSVIGNTVSLSSDTGSGVMYLWFGTDPNPSDDDIIAGSGTGFRAQRNFAVSSAGGATTEWDLSAHEGVDGYLFALQVSGDGAFSNRLFIESTPRINTALPAAFAPGDWSVADKRVGGTVAVAVSALPWDGGAALTAIEYQIAGGAWQSLTTTPSTGVYDITGLSDGTSVSLGLRAVNSNGAGSISDTKSVTPTTSQAIVLSNFAQDVTTDPVAISFDASSSAVGAGVYVEVHDSEAGYPGRGFGALGSHNIGTLSGGTNIELETGFLLAYAGFDVVLYVTVGPEWASNALGGATFTAPPVSGAMFDPDGTPWIDPDGTPLEE
ncbi:MAG: fibronectin type III domain-containing protein [Pseudomonadota bacterium]